MRKTEMKNVILIRFGEIFLKGSNRYYFEGLLKRNIKKALTGLTYTFSFSQNRYYVTGYGEREEEVVIARLKKVFGIYSVSKCREVNNDYAELAEVVRALFVPKSGSFRVTVNRADKTFPIKSPELAARLGGEVLDINPNLKVDLFHADTEILVDMRENGKTYVYGGIILCANGMPVGCSGTGLLLLSGGIDSPVAGYMMAKRGMKIDAVHFHSFPYTSEQALDKVIRLGRIMREYCLDFNLYVVPFTKIQEAIHEKCPEEFMIALMRRFMMRIARRIASLERSQAILTGESLGQVASQTVESITSSNSVVTDMPVLRPLIGMDKMDIIEIANKINTYSTSIEPFEDCCTVFLPKNPVIHPKLAKVLEHESFLDTDALIEDAMANVRIEKIEAARQP
jgi:thiamine biosynthesis protein ThiI